MGSFIAPFEIWSISRETAARRARWVNIWVSEVIVLISESPGGIWGHLIHFPGYRPIPRVKWTALMESSARITFWAGELESNLFGERYTLDMTKSFCPSTLQKLKSIRLNYEGH